jgi:hypothetical protein
MGISWECDGNLLGIYGESLTNMEIFMGLPNLSFHQILPSGYLTLRHGKSLFLIGKPSISMGHLYHGYVSYNQRVVGEEADSQLMGELIIMNHCHKSPIC